MTNILILILYYSLFLDACFIHNSAVPHKTHKSLAQCMIVNLIG